MHHLRFVLAVLLAGCLFVQTDPLSAQDAVLRSRARRFRWPAPTAARTRRSAKLYPIICTLTVTLPGVRPTRRY